MLTLETLEFVFYRTGSDSAALADSTLFTSLVHFSQKLNRKINYLLKVSIPLSLQSLLLRPVRRPSNS